MEFTHFDEQGNARMVDVTAKGETVREAVAKGRIRVSEECFGKIKEGTMAKGDVLGVARIAGIMGAKRTSELIPLCHILNLTKLNVDFNLHPETCEIEAVCTAKTTGKTGVEMEALTGVSVTLLTIYDMCKAVDKAMEIGDIHLAEKTGGKSGHFVNPREQGGEHHERAPQQHEVDPPERRDVVDHVFEDIRDKQLCDGSRKLDAHGERNSPPVSLHVS